MLRGMRESFRLKTKDVLMLLNKRTVGATQQPCNTRLGIRVGIEGKWTGIEVVLAINASPFFQGRLLVLFHQRPKSCDF